jgi:hypothetical protein
VIFGPSFLWVLAGIPSPEQDVCFEYYIIPSKDIATNVSAAHKLWLNTPGAKGQAHRNNPMRNVFLPPLKSRSGWDISEYRNRWNLVEQLMRAP